MPPPDAAFSFFSPYFSPRFTHKRQNRLSQSSRFVTTIRHIDPFVAPRPRQVRCSYGAGAVGKPAIDEEDGRNLIHIVFVHPQIHWNTGNIGRTCLGLGASLHLIGPLGFSLDEKQIRRAGLDYWHHVDVSVYENWEEFANGRMQEIGGTRFFFTKFGAECATTVQWPKEGKIVLVFGSEVDGFDGIRDWLETAGSSERRVAFPMVDDRFRSFNLSTTASMVSRAVHVPQIQVG